MDVLSEVLRLVRMTGAVFLNAELTAPWLTESPPSNVLAESLMPEAEHLIEYHLIVEGRCHIKLLDGEPILLEPGDVVMFPKGDPHLMGSDLDAEAISAENLVMPAVGITAPRQYGGGGAMTRVVCGYLSVDRTLCASLIAALPRMLRVSACNSEVSGWLQAYMRFSLVERSEERPGGACVLAKLSELLFIEAIRRYVESLPAEQSGWLAGVRDPFVGRALGLLHGSPAQPWTVESLGRQIGLSRSSFAERFVELIGQPPMQYLTQWRLTLAAHLLRTTNKATSLIADEVGYDSEAAFNRAFKRELGSPPATWRKQTTRAPAVLTMASAGSETAAAPAV